MRTKTVADWRKGKVNAGDVRWSKINSTAQLFGRVI